MNKSKKITAALLSAAMLFGSVLTVPDICKIGNNSDTLTAYAADTLDMADFPSEYQYAADWIWNNRIMNEDSMGINSKRWNGLFDQIVAGKGTINYVVKWQSYRQVTYEQRQKLEQMLSDGINDWAKWLVGYDDWPYDHIEVKIVGWAVIDKSCLLDLHDDEIVYTDTKYYDSQYDNPNGVDVIPDKEPYAPAELSRFEHFQDKSYEYPGGLDKRFDMYMWATQGFPDIGGCGGDWGQRLSDKAYLNMLDGSGIHVFEHEVGHCFGMTDFYGGEGATDGFPPGGFPGGENSLMMAGSASKITDFDGWMLRYMWSKVKDNTERFDLSNAKPDKSYVNNTFEDTVAEVGNDYILFENNGKFTFGDNYFGSDESKNLSHYEPGDSIKISMTYTESSKMIVSIDSLELIHNVSNIKGDVNGDGKFNVADVVALQEWLVGKNVDLANRQAGNFVNDGKLNIFDLCLMKSALLAKDDPVKQLDFIEAPIKEIDSSLPSQGDANLVVFYVDFPDCTYGNSDLTAEQVEKISFGAANENDANYPFESMSAFFDRSSKGAMKLNGKVFRYTTKENRAAYDTDKVKLAEECYEAFKDQVNFADFDSDKDGYVDATLFTVPTAAGDTDWWPCSGAFGNPNYVIDGVKVGNIITGNAQIESLDNYSNFVSSYLHEMGHCLGLPDYYLYNSSDSEGFHGSAGYELMDMDAFSDFSAFTKLMLGWYDKDQVEVFNTWDSSQTYTISSAQTINGNCVVIPMNDLNGNYASGEYFILEFVDNSGNNDVSKLHWWQNTSSGIRIFHVKPEIHDNGWFKHFKYQNGSEFTDSNGDGKPDDEGIRFVRLVNDGGDAFSTGAVINNSTSGFGWYDSAENESIDPGIEISVGECRDGKYTVTITRH